MTADGERFDQTLYDAVMAEAPTSEYERAQWMDAADIAARIAAERAPVAVSDAELGNIFAEALEREHAKGAASNRQELGQKFIAGIRAVRAAIEQAQNAPPSH